MTVTVSIPTVLRPFTGGAKSVPASGGTLAEVIDDLDAHHRGIAARLVTGSALHRFVNIYIGDDDVRYTGGLGSAVPDGAGITILPAVAGG